MLVKTKRSLKINRLSIDTSRGGIKNILHHLYLVQRASYFRLIRPRAQYVRSRQRLAMASVHIERDHVPN
ncbi:hypothetical protein OUZ56_008384 [Daphnia magna]|uniref:Uncharacterized protein n=1 Tax=Daphnia magna TaxID=35525 RepID=A0ABR0ACU7_9CRUS|nr:hypothetical protein OUZ56_008384 [Daphnia magna]